MDLNPQIIAFRDIEYLKDTLSKNGISGFRPWRNDGYKWISFSDYQNFGTGSGKFGAQNNVAYYISSDFEEFAQEVKLVLNINNTLETKEALDTFIRIALKTFTSLNITPPQNLLNAINGNSEMECDEESYSCELKILKTNIFTWSLIIKSK